MPLFEKDKPTEREIYFSHLGNKALRQGKWKAVISSDIDGRWQLYNMENDPVEVHFCIKFSAFFLDYNIEGRQRSLPGR